ncbi:MAG: hypothetical protein ACOX7D_00640 [Alphaproteobacteria bacterium]|jgi:hypothetical protein
MRKFFYFLIIVLFSVEVYASDGSDLMIYDDVSVYYQSGSLAETDKLLLEPNNITENLWANVKQSRILESRCPFQSSWECNIWKKKPTVIETMVLPARHIKKDRNYHNALIKRYETLMQVTNICCVSGMEYRLKKAGADQNLIYKFMTDDANFYGFGDRCLMMSDKSLEERHPKSATVQMVAEVRDTCLCQRRDYFDALLAPFDDFPDEKYEYSYYDGLKREVQVSISDDVKFIKEQLVRCPE